MQDALSETQLLRAPTSRHLTASSSIFGIPSAEDLLEPGQIFWWWTSRWREGHLFVSNYGPTWTEQTQATFGSSMTFYQAQVV